MNGQTVTITANGGGAKKSKSARRRERRKQRGAGQANSTQSGVKASSTTVVVNTNSRGRGRRRGRNGGRGRVLRYLDYLSNPALAGGRVPDLVSYPSTPIQLKYEGTITTGATAGDTAAVLCSPIIGDGSTKYPIATANNVAAGSFATQTNISWANRGTVSTLFDLIRPVSAGLWVESILASSADGGMIAGALLPKLSNVPSTWATLSVLPDAKVESFKRGMFVGWKPTDNADLEYTNASSGSGSVAAFTSLPSLIVAATGFPINTTVAHFTFIANFEVIPQTDAMEIVETAPSTVNLQDLQEAFNWERMGQDMVQPIINSIVPLGLGALSLAAARTTRRNGMPFDVYGV